MILDKHIIAFLLTLGEDLFDMAKSIMVSVKAATSKSGTIVAIKDNASDWAASFLDLISASIECTIDLHI